MLPCGTPALSVKPPVVGSVAQHRAVAPLTPHAVQTARSASAGQLGRLGAPAKELM